MRGIFRAGAALLLAAVACRGGADGEAPRSFDLAAFRDPPAAARPWVRWWWPGGDVDEAEIRREVRLLADNDFGGAEVQPIDAALDRAASPDEKARRRSFGTPVFRALLSAALDEARAAGIGIDLNLGSGWPTGGPSVAVERSMRTLVWTERRVQGPGPATLSLPEPDRPAWYDVAAVLGSGADGGTRFRPDLARLVAVVAAPVTGGARTTDLLDFSDRVDLDGTRVVVLTDRVAADRSLAWVVPDGTWQVVAFFDMPTGESPIFEASPDGPGALLDPFDRDEVLRFLDRELGDATGLAAYAGAPLRAVFVDSLELKNERFFATDFLAEFARRRGYDPVPLLPAVLVPGADNNVFDGGALPVAAAFSLGPDDDRVRRDWQQTAAELFVERFVATAREWLAARGLRLRFQAHGANLDTLAAYGAADVPETEQLYAGGADAFLKMASSAAHLYGRDLTAAESLVWMQRDHALTPTAMKAAADKLFAAGVNHLIYHGFPYRIGADRGYGEAGWHPFSSPHGGSSTYSELIGEASPFWQDMAAFNRYVARCQVALRAGEPEADLLVPYPWHGFPASYVRLEDHEEPLFCGAFDPADPSPARSLRDMTTAFFGPPALGPRERWVTAADALLHDLHARGWSWDWADPGSLAEARVASCGIRIRGGCWRGVLVPPDTPLDPAVAARIDALAAAGAPVVRAAGPDGAGVSAALHAVGLGPGVAPATPAPALAHVSRRLGPGARVAFLANSGRDPIDTSVTVEGGCASPVRLDPWTGEATRLSVTAAAALPVVLPAYGSAIVACGLPDAPAILPEPPARGPTTAVPVAAWTLTVTADDVPGGTASLLLDRLADWRTLAPLKHSGGPGTYRARVDLPPLQVGGKVTLDLGRVEGVAEVTWNGKPGRRLIVPPFQADVTEAAVPGRNEVEVRVTVPARNRFVGGQSGQFAGKGDDALVAAGLIGPVEVRVAGEGLPPLPDEVPVLGALASRPSAAVLPAGVESCAVLGEERCAAGGRERCEIHDAAGGFGAGGDPFVEQVFRYDRYYDLYHRMEGQQAEFLYTEPMPPGTPEEVWGDPARFWRGCRATTATASTSAGSGGRSRRSGWATRRATCTCGPFPGCCSRSTSWGRARARTPCARPCGASCRAR